jgi:nucleoside-diphosphate-sugar epimerase
MASRYALFYRSTRAEKELGYRPEKTFREAVELMYDSLRRGGTL